MMFRTFFKLRTLTLTVVLLSFIVIWTSCKMDDDDSPNSPNNPTKNLPDLIINNVSWEPNLIELQPGTTVRFTFRVKNIGNAPAHGYVRVFETENYSYNGGFASGLNVGEEKIATLDYPFMNWGETYSIKFVVNAKYSIQESNNSNNDFRPITIKTKSGGIYEIKSLANGLYLDAHLPDVNKNGCKVQLWNYNGDPNQTWVVQGDGPSCTIRTASSGLYLDAHNPDVNKNGCKVQLWKKAGGDNQLWKIYRNGNVYRIASKKSGLVLDAFGPDVNKNGCKVQLWQYHGGANQSWVLIPK